MGRRNTPTSFWARIAQPPEGCWEWLGCKERYGLVKYQGKRWQSHRLAWTLANGAIPSGFHVLHTCDNPACCRPSHLFLGTQADNVLDMIAKGRRWTGKIPSGETSVHAKLTAAQVKEIRASHEPQGVLSERFGVSRQQIGGILAGQTWKDVTKGIGSRPPGWGRKGEQNQHAKLTNNTVVEIRNSTASTAVLAKRFGVSWATIWRVRAGVGWKLIPGVGKPAPARSTAEMTVRNILNRAGITGWQSYAVVFGHPDVVFVVERVAIFVDGCFWHSCPQCALPDYSAIFTVRREQQTRRDAEVSAHLLREQWTVLRFWEHELRDEDGVAQKVAKALKLVMPVSIEGVVKY